MRIQLLTAGGDHRWPYAGQCGHHRSININAGKKEGLEVIEDVF